MFRLIFRILHPKCRKTGGEFYIFSGVKSPESNNNDENPHQDAIDGVHDVALVNVG